MSPEETQDTRRKLCGVAYFDEPDNAPEEFEAIVLWHQSHSSVHYRPFYPNDKRDDLVVPDYGDKKDIKVVKWRVLTDRQHTVFGVESRHGVLRISDPYFSSVGAKQLYYLLFVQRTKREDHYRRVGVAIAYWIPYLERFGGLALHRPKSSLQLAQAEKATPSEGFMEELQRVVLV